MAAYCVSCGKPIDAVPYVDALGNTWCEVRARTFSALLLDGSGTTVFACTEECIAAFHRGVIATSIMEPS